MEPVDILVRMSKALDSQSKDAEEACDWYEGEHPVPPAPHGTLAAHDAEARVAFIAMSKLAVTNFLPPIVDTPAAALRIEGFRFPGAGTQAAADAWEIWQRNYLDSDSDLGNHQALKSGNAYALVWADGDGLAEITVEHPEQAIVWYQPGSRRKRQAGLKRWMNDDGFLYATLYLPDAIYKYQSSVPADRLSSIPTGQSPWVPRGVSGEPWPLPNPLGVVPLVEIRANADLEPCPFGGGEPEFDKQVTDQRRINKTVLDMLITMEHQSFRQRWVTGWDPPTLSDGVTPDKAAILKASAARLWTFDDPDTKVGDFSQADFAPFLSAVQAWVKVMAATSATPPYAFMIGDMINVASDSLARIEGQQTNKVKAHARRFGEAWEEVIRLALTVESNDAASDMTISTVWAGFEQRTATEQANLAAMAKALGVPRQDYLAMLPDVDQQTAQRWADEALALDLLNPPPVPMP